MAIREEDLNTEDIYQRVHTVGRQGPCKFIKKELKDGTRIIFTFKFLHTGEIAHVSRNILEETSRYTLLKSNKISVLRSW